MGVTTAATASEPPAYMLPGVNLFASGVYRGKPWKPFHVRQMQANAGKLARLLTPPAAPGHEDDDGWQEFVRTDEPAAGWVDPKTVHCVPDPDHPGELILRGDVVNVPAAMAQKILSGEYQYGSSEIYDSFKDDFGRDYGKALRKFSYLGGEVPQVKRLGKLPAPVPMTALRKFSEKRPGVHIRAWAVRNGSTVHTHAETTVMDRPSMMAAIQAAMPGLSQSTLDAMSDEQLADLVKNVSTASPVATAPVAPAAPSGLMADMTREELIAALTEAGEDAAELEGMEDDELQALLDELEGGGEGGEEEAEVETMGDPATMSRDELIAELTAAGQDAAALQAMTDDDLRAMYAEAIGGATASAPAAPAAPVTPMSERRRMTTATRKPAAAFAERQSKKLLRNLNRLNTFAEREHRRLQASSAAAKRRDATAFCEQLVREGRDTPAGVQAKTLPLLLAMDDTAPVHRFTESGRTRKVTAYELKKAELAKLPPVVRFGERLGTDETVDGDREVRIVKRFAEVNGESLKKTGTTPTQFVEKFSEMRKKRPDLTAEQLLGPEAKRYA